MEGRRDESDVISLKTSAPLSFTKNSVDNKSPTTQQLNKLKKREKLDQYREKSKEKERKPIRRITTHRRNSSI